MEILIFFAVCSQLKHFWIVAMFEHHLLSGVNFLSRIFALLSLFYSIQAFNII